MKKEITFQRDIASFHVARESRYNPRSYMTYDIRERYAATVISFEFDTDCSRNNKKRNRFAQSIRRKQDLGRKN